MKNLLYFISLFLLGFVLGCICVGRCGSGEVRTHSDTLTVFDTIPFFQPIPRDSTVIRYVTVRLPVNDTISCYDTVRVDSAAVVVPITQKAYIDSAYRAYVSGYLPNLDSLIITQRSTVVTNTVTRPAPRFSFSLQAGVGALYDGRLRFGPYVGAGVSIRLGK